MIYRLKYNYKRLKESKRKGFTLVELIVAMGALGVLASIVAFNVTSYVQKADDARNEANVKQVHKASEFAVQTNTDIRVKDIYGLMTNEADSLKREIASFANIKAERLELVEYALANKHSEEGIYYISPDISEDEHKIVVRYNTKRGTYWFEKKADDVAGHEILTMPENPDDIEGDVNFRPKDEVASGDKVHNNNPEDSKVIVEVDGKSYQDVGIGKNKFPGVNDFFSLSGTHDIKNIKLKPNTYYTMSSNIPGSISEAAAESRHIYFGSQSHTDAVFLGHSITKKTDSSGRIAVAFYLERKLSNKIIDGEYCFQIEEGSVSTSYQRHREISPDNPAPIKSLKEFDIISSKTVKSKSQLESILYDTKQNGTYKTKVKLNSPLRSVGDIHDRLFKDTDNLWKIERNVGYKNLDNNSNSWSSPQQANSNYANFYSRNSYIGMDRVHDRNSPIMTSWLETIPQQAYRILEREAIVRWSDVVPFVIVIKTDRIGGDSSADMNNYLKSNPLDILYELKNPTVETLPRSLQTKLNNIPSFQGSNHVYTVVENSKLTPELHVTFKSRK